MTGPAAHIYVLDNIHLAHILAQRTDTDAMAAFADEVLNNYIRAIRLEGNATISIVDVRVLNHNIGTAIGIPSASIRLSIDASDRGFQLTYPSSPPHSHWHSSPQC
jgi:hypothetical protein